MSDNQATRALMPHVVIASFDEEGRETFITKDDFLFQEFGEVAGRAWLWGIEGMPSIPGNMGGFPKKLDLPSPGDVKFALVWVAPETVGKQDYMQGPLVDATDFQVAEDPDLHITDTFDLAVILQGEADMILPNKQVTQVRKGSVIMQGGIQHSWRVTSKEPLVFLFTIIGAKRDK